MGTSAFGGSGVGAVTARTLVAASFGWASAQATGGDGAQAALIAATVHLFNSELGRDPYSAGELKMEVDRSLDGTNGTLRIFEGDEIIYEGDVFNREQSSTGDPFGANRQISDNNYQLSRRVCSNCKYQDFPGFQIQVHQELLMAPMEREELEWYFMMEQSLRIVQGA